MKKKTSLKQGIDTRNLYEFEKVVLSKVPSLSQLHSMWFLREVADKAWRKHGNKWMSKELKCPKIVAGKGIKYNGRCLSYYDDVQIVLARQERNVLTVLHELTHALGYNTHGHQFVRQYLDSFGLLEQFGYPPSKLYELADYHGFGSQRLARMYGVPSQKHHSKCYGYR